MNAQKELLNHTKGLEVKYVRVLIGKYFSKKELIEGTLDEVLPKLDFEYDSGYGSQHITGIIWYTDGTWSERGEYDGSEWWEYHKCPTCPIS